MENSKRQRERKNGALSTALTYLVSLSPVVYSLGGTISSFSFNRLYDGVNNDQQTEKKTQSFRIHLLLWV